MIKNKKKVLKLSLGHRFFILINAKNLIIPVKFLKRPKDARNKVRTQLPMSTFIQGCSSGKELVDYLKKNKVNKIEDAMEWIKEQHINKWGKYHLTTAK